MPTEFVALTNSSSLHLPVSWSEQTAPVLQENVCKLANRNVNVGTVSSCVVRTLCFNKCFTTTKPMFCERKTKSRKSSSKALK